MLGLILCLFLDLNGAQAQELDAENDPAVFRRQVEQLNQRYEDFFAHEQRLKLYENNLKRAIPELKTQREAYNREALESLRQYRLQRKVKTEDARLELEDQRDKKAQELVQERHRREYVSRREQLSRISESARKVPANSDAGLE